MRAWAWAALAAPLVTSYFACGGGSASDPGAESKDGVVVFASGVVDVSGSTFLMADGSVFGLEYRESAPYAIVRLAVPKMIAIREDLAIDEAHHVWNLHDIPAKGPLQLDFDAERLLGENYVRKQDGTVHYWGGSGTTAAPVPSADGADAFGHAPTIGVVAARGGRLLRFETDFDAGAILSKEVDVGGSVTELEGTFLLREDGIPVRLFANEDSGVPGQPWVPVAIEGLPPIAHLRAPDSVPVALEDSAARIWYWGWIDTQGGLPSVLLPPDAETYTQSNLKTTHTYVRLMHVPALDGTRPFFDVQYLWLLEPSGRLRCWRAVPAAPACPHAP